MRWLSMSLTFSWHNSARRIPVEYSVISIVRCNRLLAESISGYLFLAQDSAAGAAALGNGMSSSM